MPTIFTGKIRKPDIKVPIGTIIDGKVYFTDDYFKNYELPRYKNTRTGETSLNGLLSNANISESGTTVTLIVGSTLTIAGTINVTGTFKLGGATVTSSAAEINFNDGSVAGTVVASKTVVVDSNKDISAFRNVIGVNYDAGSSGVAGSYDVFPTTAAKGKLSVVATDNTNNDTITITNAAQAGARTYTIPDAGASAFFVMSTGTQTLTADATDYQQFVGIASIVAVTVGTWTITRIAQGNFAYRKTVANDTSIIGIDITPEIRTGASKGFKLDSFDVIYSIATADLDAHTVTLDKVNYANNTAVTVTNIGLTGSLAVAQQANPYATAITVSSPAFNNTADSKYVIELTVDASLLTAYDYYGIVLKFTRNVL